MRTLRVGYDAVAAGYVIGYVGVVDLRVCGEQGRDDRTADAHTVFLSSRVRHTRFDCDWSSDVCSSDLSAAASELNVTPAAVSQQVRLLELRLGEKLFVRHARGLRLTLAGEALVPVCRESFERLDTVLAELFGDRGKQQLVIRVSLGFARQWLLERLAGVAPEHPEIPIRPATTVWAREPLDSSVDVGIPLRSGEDTSELQSQSKLVCRPL